jgi:DMSO reductase family type II enzyme heme b subunit
MSDRRKRIVELVDAVRRRCSTMSNDNPTERRELVAVLATLALVTLAGTALVPMLAEARPANQIPVESAAADANLSNPTAEGWADAPTVTVPLSASAAAVPEGSSTSVQDAKVQVQRSDTRLYVRMRWDDATADRAVDSPRTFGDAAAVQLPVNTTERPAITMGSSRNHVNVWYWSGHGGSEELLAGGPGSTTQFQNASVETTAVHENGTWYLVYERDLVTGTDNRTAIRMERDVDVAFAVWNGSNMERSGRKSVSEWYHMALGPGPSGPPYETLLWAIAGLAIVLVTLLTVEGVRRTR